MQPPSLLHVRMTHPIHFRYTWDQFLEMFVVQYSTEYYGDQFPEFAQYFDTLPGDQWDAAYLGFVDVAIHRGGTPSEMMQGFVLACLAAHRMILDDGGKSMRLILNRLFQYGAVFPNELLFLRRYHGEETLEDEIQDYPVRGLLIDLVMSHRPFDVRQFADWSSIEELYWEDLDYSAPASEYDRLGCLKSHSTVLKSM